MASRVTPTSPSERSRAPELVSAATGITHPFLDACPPFMLVFTPDRWTIVAGKLIPALHRLPLVAGVNNVEVDKNGRIFAAKLRARLEMEGRTPVPFEWAPDGQSYLQAMETRPGGGPNVAETWITAWETCEAGSSETSTDEAAYADWLLGLVKAGRLPACSPPVIRRMHERAVERLAVAVADAAKLGGAGKASLRAKALEIEVEVLAAELEKAKGRKVVGRVRTPELQGGDT